MADRLQNADTSTGGNNHGLCHQGIYYNQYKTFHYIRMRALNGITGKQTGPVVARSAQGS